jgi:hypothetical protein
LQVAADPLEEIELAREQGRRGKQGEVALGERVGGSPQELALLSLLPQVTCGKLSYKEPGLVAWKPGVSKRVVCLGVPPRLLPLKPTWTSPKVKCE